ncbi:hypothetical protein B7494_g7380 [Chlorociboria aeruginascens]|nr:hypothetical protein B7494_g7380 [Chlorociboria aeruginascens]
MPARHLGGGRILGSGKSLAPPAVSAHHQRSSSLISPSESTLSLSSRDSASPLATSPLPDLGQDLGSRVQLESGGPSSAAPSKLVCPICTEEMMTLLQLNRHLDDNHQELPEVQQDEVKNWFDKQVIKAKKFQPLAVINQKLKGLDVFESNDIPSMSSPAPSIVSGNRVSTPEPSRPDPDELVTRTHWQRGGYNDMKLSRSAQHDPVRGFWCRVCETCFKSREGYNDHSGYIRDHIKDFKKIRGKTVEKAHLEISRLEKRLTKLTQLLANPPEDISGNGSILSIAGQKNQRKLLEQSVVTWEEDATVLKCPFCQQEFGSWSFRRHHCRLCGRVVCADPRTGCSSEIGLNVSPPLSLDIRMCKTCQTTIFAHKDFLDSSTTPPPIQRLYINLLQFQAGIRTLLPTFQTLLSTLQSPSSPPSPAQLTEATKVRKRLMDSFAKYDVAAKRIRDLPTQSEAQKKLQKAIYTQSSNFLHLHMLPLKSLPRILKHASPHGSSPLNGRSALSSIKYNDTLESASQISSNSALSVLETEEKELRERMAVLEEQRFFVGEMVEDAKRRRKWDEVEALRGNMADLENEIRDVEGLVGRLDFRGVYEAEREAGR